MNSKSNIAGMATIGSILLIIGCFTPLFSISFLGKLTIDFYNDGNGDGIFVIGLAVISFVLIIIQQFKGLFITGGLSLAIIAYDFFNIRSELAQDDFASSLIKTEWGWLVLFAGAGLVVFAALQSLSMSSKKGHRSSPYDHSYDDYDAY